MKVAGILWLVAACGTAKPPPTTAPVVTSDVPACRDAYAEYEVQWRLARTDELQEFVAGDEGVLEEILFYELAALPSRAEVTKLREMYAVIDAFLWNAPWPKALTAAETAIARCGEQSKRPTVATR